MIKRQVILFAVSVFFSTALLAQAKVGDTEITKKNSWLKTGLTAGIPVGNLADVSNFTAGVDLKGQLMTTPHVGIGLVTGYNHFFGKSGFKSFGNIPLGVFARFYPAYKGFFAGVDGGYSFMTGTDANDGGVYLRPQLGYHNYDWNFFGFYNHVFRDDQKGGSIQYAGVGFTYNIRFK